MPVFEPYLHTMGASLAFIGVILGSYGLTQFMLRMPLGMLGGKAGRQKPFVAGGMLVCLLASLGMYLLPMPGWFLCFRSLSGVSASVWVNLSAMVGNQGSNNKVMLSYASALTYTGQLLATFCGDILSRSINIRFPFMLSVVTSALCIVLVLTIKEEKVFKDTPRFKELFLVVKDRQLLLLSLLAFILQMVAFSTVYGFVPDILKTMKDSARDPGLVATCFALTSLIGSLAASYVIARKRHEKGFLLHSILLCALSALALPLCQSILAVYVTQIVNGWSRGVLLTTALSFCASKIAPEKKSSAIGFYQATYAFGILAGPVLAGFVGHSFGLSASFVIIGAFGLIGAALCAKYISKPMT